MEKLKVPQFFRFIIPIIDVLKELDGSGRAGEVTDRVIERLNISEEELSNTIKSGASRIKNQIQWARFMLVKTDYLDSSQHGVWTLTEKGLKAELTQKDLAKLYAIKKELEKEYKQAKSEMSEKVEPKLVHEETYDDEEYTEDTNYKTEALNLLQSLPASGFERICQRLLRESGFEQVVVTGKSGDGGIDGIGLLQVNPFVSFKVLFQCKRYQKTVSPSQVRDFRGAMQGRADKGIIMTTGTFTTEAKKEARRDGVPPIDLVDGDKLIEMFELLELGLKPRKTYDVDRKFFDEFMK
jgi:restriction system protein